MTGPGAGDRWPGRIAAVVAALWMGSLWTVCALVAPTLFALLDDPRLAGDIAGALFRVEAWLGLALGVVLYGLLRSAGRADGRTTAWIVAAALPPVLHQFALLPSMSAARAVRNMALFGALHLVAAALFLAACAAATVVVVRLSRPAA